MTRVAIVVEGRTEEEFVNRLLAGHLRDHELVATPILHGLKRHHRKRMSPYIQQFEFEALLFANVKRFSVIGASAEVIAGLESVLADAGNDPESIDDGVTTAPSKRIIRLLDSYDKLLDGLLVAEETGLRRIRERCRRFNQWITELELLSR